METSEAASFSRFIARAATRSDQRCSTVNPAQLMSRPLTLTPRKTTASRRQAPRPSGAEGPVLVPEKAVDDAGGDGERVRDQDRHSEHEHQQVEDAEVDERVQDPHHTEAHHLTRQALPPQDAGHEPAAPWFRWRKKACSRLGGGLSLSRSRYGMTGANCPPMLPRAVRAGAGGAPMRHAVASPCEDVRERKTRPMGAERGTLRLTAKVSVAASDARI